MQALPLLDPSPFAIGVFPQHYNHGQTVSLRLSQKTFSWSKGDYTVTGMDGNPVFIVKGAAMSMHRRRALSDAQGTELFELANEVLHLHPTFVAKRLGAEREVFRVQKQKVWSFHDDLTVAVWNEATMREETLHLRGNWLDRQCEVRLGSDGPVLACATRDLWTAKQIFAQASTYAIHVAPGVDTSLIVALCICLDEIHEQKGASAGIFAAA